MTCCGLPTLDLQAPRNADFRRSISPTKGFTFNGFSAHMQLREEPGDATVLLDLGMTQTPNGSYFQVIGDSFVLTIKKNDLGGLPDPVAPSVAVSLWYDIVVTDQTGLESYLFGGRFIVIEGITQ